LKKRPLNTQDSLTRRGKGSPGKRGIEKQGFDDMAKSPHFNFSLKSTSKF
jgi:hypothetical protein